ncbi:MAG: hypothetical protein O3A63_20660 [Proteobacteria bacterium]|nr:hypothetical protein [Pseudomonadota bacterium]
MNFAGNVPIGYHDPLTILSLENDDGTKHLKRVFDQKTNRDLVTVRQKIDGLLDPGFPDGSAPVLNETPLSATVKLAPVAEQP